MIDLARTVRPFAGGIALVQAANVAAQVARVQSAPAPAWARWIDVDVEWNVPTFFSSLLLFACALAAWRRSWRLLSVALACVAFDEVAGYHERVAAHLLEMARAHALPSGAVWLVGGVVVALASLLFVPLLRSLDAPLRRKLVASAIVYVTGALLFEAIAQRWAATHGWSNATYAALTTIEELLEMLGALLFLRAATAADARAALSFTSSNRTARPSTRARTAAIPSSSPSRPPASW